MGVWVETMIMSQLHLDANAFHVISRQWFDVREKRRWRRGYGKGTWQQSREEDRKWTLETISLVFLERAIPAPVSRRTPGGLCYDCITALLWGRPLPWPASLIYFRYYISKYLCSKVYAHKSKSQSVFFCVCFSVCFVFCVFLRKPTHNCLWGEEAK